MLPETKKTPPTNRRGSWLKSDLGYPPRGQETIRLSGSMVAKKSTLLFDHEDAGKGHDSLRDKEKSYNNLAFEQIRRKGGKGVGIRPNQQGFSKLKKSPELPKTGQPTEKRKLGGSGIFSISMGEGTGTGNES